MVVVGGPEDVPADLPPIAQGERRLDSHGLVPEQALAVAARVGAVGEGALFALVLDLLVPVVAPGQGDVLSSIFKPRRSSPLV